MRIFLLCLSLLLSLSAVSAAVWKGKASGDFQFLGKFVFDEDPSGTKENPEGSIDIFIQSYLSINQSESLMIALYDDEVSASKPTALPWSKIWHSSYSCSEKIDHSKYNQSILLTDTTPYISLHLPIDSSVRARFFFVALAKCDGTGFNNIDYNVHFLNLKHVEWNQEFGADQYGLNSLYLSMFFIYLLYIVVQLYSTKKLYSRITYLHPLIRLFLSVILFQFLSIMFNMIHFVSYSGNGIGYPAIEKLGEIVEIFARISFFLLLLLLARGWTISNEELRYKWWLIGAVFIFLIVHIAVLIWKYAIADPAETNIDSGLFFFLNFLIGCMLVFAIAFIIFVIRSWQKEENNPIKRSLYLKLLMFFGPWFLTPPLTTVAVYELDDWARDRVVRVLTVLVSTVAYFILSFLLWHSKAEDYFEITTPSVENSAFYEHL